MVLSDPLFQRWCWKRSFDQPTDRQTETGPTEKTVNTIAMRETIYWPCRHTLTESDTNQFLK